MKRFCYLFDFEKICARYLGFSIDWFCIDYDKLEILSRKLRSLCRARYHRSINRYIHRYDIITLKFVYSQLITSSIVPSCIDLELVAKSKAVASLATTHIQYSVSSVLFIFFILYICGLNWR